MKNQKKFLRNLELQHQHQQTFQKKYEGPLLCIDYGTKKIGLAHSPDGQLVFPLAVVPAEQFSVEIRKILKEKKIKKVIWGLPRSDDGEISTLGKQIQKEAEKYSSLCKYDFVRERKSTQVANNQTISGEYPDAIAAAVMLEWYLEKKTK